MLALTGPQAVDQRRVDHRERHIGAGRIGHRASRAQRRPAGYAGEGTDATHAERHAVVARLVTLRAVLSETRNRRINDRRVERAHRLVAETHLGGSAGQEVLDDHIGARRQDQREIAALGFFQVDRDAALVPVHRREGRADAVLAADVAHVVASTRPLDLDHIRAEIGEQHSAIGSRDDARQIENLDSFEHGDLMVSVGRVAGMIAAIQKTDGGATLVFFRTRPGSTVAKEVVQSLGCACIGRVCQGSAFRVLIRDPVLPVGCRIG